MKKFTKIISLTLAVLMLVLALPISAVAAEASEAGSETSYSTYSYDLNDLEPVLKANNLTEIDGKASMRNTKEPNGNVVLSTDPTDTTSSIKGANWMAYMEETDIDIDMDSQYTIKFKVGNSHASVMYYGFTFSGVVDATSAGYAGIVNNLANIGLGQGDFSGSTIGGFVAKTGNFAGTTADPNMRDVMIVFDKGLVTLYLDNVRMFDRTITTKNFNDNGTFAGVDKGTRYLPTDKIVLGIFATPWYNNLTLSGDVFSMSDIEIYKGCYDATYRDTNPSFDANNGNLSEADLLVSLANLSAENTVENSTVELFDISTANNTPNGDVALSSSAWANKHGPAITPVAMRRTDIDVTSDSQFTLTFEAGYAHEKIDYMALLFAGNGEISTNVKMLGLTQLSGEGRLQLNNGAFTIHAYNSSWYRLNDRYFIKDVMRDFTVVFDKGTVKAYIDGNEFYRVTLASDFDYSGYNIMFGAWACQYSGATINDANILSMRNIKLYEGAYDPTVRKVDFVGLDGKYIEEKTVAPGTTVNAFPNVEASEGKLVKWFYKGTDTVALAAHTVNKNTVFEAREVDPATFNAVVAVQATEPVDNKMNLRFIATFDTLEATDAGFEIIAYYEQSGGKASQEWNPEATQVFTAINAETNGSVVSVTAEQLGGEYIIALDVMNVPDNIGQVDFYARSYITVNGVKQYNGYVVFSMNNGTFDSTLTPAFAAPEGWAE